MNLEQVNHFEREGVLPIAFSLFHFTRIEDQSASLLGAGPEVYNDGWASKMGLAIADHGKERAVEEMIDQRIGDYERFGEYMTLVFEKTETWPAPDSVHFQRTGGEPRGHNPPRRGGVLDLPARSSPYGGDRARPGTRRPGRHDFLTATPKVSRGGGAAASRR